MSTVLRTAATALALLLCCAATADATVVSGHITDDVGDGQTPNGVHPYDLSTFILSYDDAGALSATVVFGDPQDGMTDFVWRLFASIGVWSPSEQRCDVSSTGGVLLELFGSDVPPQHAPTVMYTVVGFAGGAQQSLGIPITSGPAFDATFSPIVDAAAFARRGYNCVVDIRLRNLAGGTDDAPGPFCMTSSGGAGSCEGFVAAPIGIRWASPQEGQTVAGFLHEGLGDCLAEPSGPVVRTENWVDGAFHDAQVNLPWGCELDTTTLSDGPHTLTVRAFAADGRSVEHTITINVANGAAALTPTTGTTAPGTPSAPTSPGPVTSPAGGSPAGSAPRGGVPGTGTGTEGAPDDTTAATRPLTVARARVLGRRALAKRYGRAFKQRTRYRASCRAVTARRISCRVRWRYRTWRYAGTVAIRRTAAGDAAVVHVKRRRAGNGP
jgi:hypothetical protein